MKITKCALDKLLELYLKAGFDYTAGLLSRFCSKVDAMTYHVQEQGQELFLAFAFCDVSDGMTDFVVAGYATSTDVEQISPLLVEFIKYTLSQNPDVTFDVVSFPCIVEDEKDPQLVPYLDKTKPGYRPVCSVIAYERTRMRLMHDAAEFQKM